MFKTVNILLEYGADLQQLCQQHTHERVTPLQVAVRIGTEKDKGDTMIAF